MKMRLTGGVALLLLIAALVTVPLAAADAKLIVTCVKESGEPIANLPVYVHEIKTNNLKEQKTNKKGVAEVKKLPEGVYRVFARAEGFSPVVVEFFALKGGDQKTLELRFKPGDATKKFYFEDPAVEQQVNQLFQDAVGLLQKNQLDPAIEKLKQALELNPTSPGARQNLALAYANQQKWDLAEQEVKQAIEDVRVLKMIASGDTKPYDDMEASLQKFLQSVPAMKIQLEADAALRAGKNELAVTKLEELMKIAPDDPAMLYNLALAQAKLRRFEDAKKTIERASALNPNDKNIQELKRLLGENEKAIILQQLQQTLAAGDEAMQQGKYQEALAKYQQVQVEAPPEIQGGVWAGIARAHLKLNQEDQAVEAYQKAIAQGQAKAPLFAQELADYYFSKDKTQEGVQVLANLYKQGTDPLDQALYNAGAAYMKKNKKPQAQALFEETLKANPEHAEAHYELGMIYFYDHKDPARAKAALTKYTQVGKDQAHLESAKAVLIVIEKTAPAAKPAAAAKPAPKKK